MMRIGGKALRQGDAAPGDLKGLRIYGMRFCPFVQRVHLVLQAKNVSYETVNVNLKSKPSWFLKVSPGGKVPLLENAEGKFVSESLIICDLLEDLFPAPALYPSDPYGKARQRTFITLFSEVPGISFKLLKLVMSGEDVNDVLKQLHGHLKVFDDALRDTNDTFLGGGTPGMADYIIWPWIERLPADMVKRYTLMSSWTHC
uniref:glutathione S-transferase omega-2-like isoform X2 n=1 Tax=Myxine glutinosa TaxID=7769 RepID=UPI00358E6F4C